MNIVVTLEVGEKIIARAGAKYCDWEAWSLEIVAKDSLVDGR